MKTLHKKILNGQCCVYKSMDTNFTETRSPYQFKNSVVSILLLPANEVCQGYVFTGVCLSVPPQADTPAQCMLGYSPPAKCMLGYTPCAVHAGIWSTSGRYVFHWNAFLFTHTFIWNKDQMCKIPFYFNFFLKMFSVTLLNSMWAKSWNAGIQQMSNLDWFLGWIKSGE